MSSPRITAEAMVFQAGIITLAIIGVLLALMLVLTQCESASHTRPGHYLLFLLCLYESRLMHKNIGV